MLKRLWNLMRRQQPPSAAAVAGAAPCLAMVCSVCGGPAKLQFTKGKGKPYIACDADSVKAILLQIYGDPRISPNVEISDAATHGVQTKPSERGGVREH